MAEQFVPPDDYGQIRSSDIAAVEQAHRAKDIKTAAEAALWLIGGIALWLVFRFLVARSARPLRRATMRTVFRLLSDKPKRQPDED